MKASEIDEGLDKWPDYTRFLRNGSLKYVLIEDCDFLFNRVKKLTEALESISKNSCCDTCQQAKLVARKALEGAEWNHTAPL